MGTQTRDERRNARLEAAFAEEQRRTLEAGSRIMVAVLLLVFAWVHVENGLPQSFFYYPPLAAIAVLLLAPYWLQRKGRAAWWHSYVFPFLLVLVFVATVMSPNPIAERSFRFPVQFRLQNLGNEVYLFLMIVGAAFSYSARVVLFTGVACALVWGSAVGFIFLRPDTPAQIPDALFRSLPDDRMLAVIGDPHRVHVGKSIREVIALLVCSWTVAAFVWRSRALAYRQADIERERANLSRYFSPNLVDELAQSDEPLQETRSQEIAVLFADIVGFTRLSSELPASAVIGLLRDFHSRMGEIVFENGGTLDKYIGDGVMATFGTPRPGVDDATRALRCALRMRAVLADWNDQRQRAGERPLRIGIGLHYGPVVVGNIGGAQRLEFAVVGDTVNVASRLERLTRTLDVGLVVSDTLVAHVRSEASAPDELLAGIRPFGNQPIRGRDESIAVWVA